MNDPRLPELNPEELAQRLDMAMARQSRLRRQQADDPRIAIAQRLANAQHPTLSPEMSARIQAKMMAAHRQTMSRRRVSRPQYTMVLRWAAVVAAAVVFFSAAALPAVANSVPGEVWYPVKRNLENIEVLVASSSTARSEVHLIQAERRINEVQVLLQRQSFDADLMVDARNSLQNYEQLTQEIGIRLASDEARAAGVTESIALLLQEAEQMQLVSGEEVVALIPTVITIPTEPTQAVAPTMPPTATPEPTQTITPAPSATLSTTEEPTVIPPAIAVEQTQLPETQPSLTDEPNLIPTITQTYTPEASSTPGVSSTPTASSTPLPTATETTEPQTVTMYALENTNIRSQPARNQPIITVLQQGEAVEVIGEDDTGKWWHVRLVDGRLGWAAKFLLSLDKPALPAAGGDGSSDGSGLSGSGSSASDSSDSGGDFGCEHPGDYCNAPGQTGNQPTPSNNNNPPSNPGGGKP